MKLMKKLKLLSKKIGEMNVDKIKLERVLKNLSEEVNKIKEEVVEEMGKINVIINDESSNA